MIALSDNDAKDGLNMKVIVDTPEGIAKQAAAIYQEILKDKPNAVLGFATGSTPLDLYAQLIKLYEAGEISFKDVTTFNLDEYVGLEPTHDQSYRYFMDTNLFTHIDLDPAEVNGVHSAANIHAHDIGDGLVDDRHGRADGAALSGMDIRHDADTAARREFIIAHPADLLDGFILDNPGKAESGIYLSPDLHHFHHFLAVEHEKPPASYKASGLIILYE